MPSQQCTPSPTCTEDTEDEDCNNEFPKCMAPAPGNCRRCTVDDDCEGRGVFQDVKLIQSQALTNVSNAYQMQTVAHLIVKHGT
mgnify:FL=1